ncbi:MAG: BtaA family protein [Gemmataceae bacterium]|nr:BtaA family protein [Gemmataceae bacterium]
MTKPTTRQKVQNSIFKAIHTRNLVYNTCWEDPRLDRVALDLGPTDRVVVISSAGCNALDYLLAGAGEVNAVDVNPIQNGLLEFKRAAIQNLEHSAFWELFGKGSTPRARQMYGDAIRKHLSPTARAYWDKHIAMFLGKGWRKSFYYRGTSGLLARLVMINANVLQRLRDPLEAMLAAKTLDEQRAIYERQIKGRLWTPFLRWFIARSFTLTLLGVPGAQKKQITTQYKGGVAQFIRDSVEAVMCQLPFRENYFWRVYIQGHYDADSCPEYLKPENYAALRAALPRLKIHTSTITEFAQATTPGLTRFVLLDHMDWMSSALPEALSEEWSALLASAAPGARAIFRSAGLKVDYLDHLPVDYKGGTRQLGSLLRYDTATAERLHPLDRVHTYGSFYIADLPN